MRFKMVLMIVLVITILGGIARFYNNTNNPPGLNIDEVAIGYNAYSILKTGKDENGSIMPIAFPSYGDYKNALPIYLLVPIVGILGLNDFSVRFLTAFFGTMTIPLLFFFLRFVSKNDIFSLIGCFMLAVSSWHIYYSRIFYEHTISLVFVILGMYFLLKVFEGKKWNSVFASFFLVMSLYSYFAERLFIPLLVFVVFVANYKKIRSNILIISVFFVLSLILSMPLIYASIFGHAGARASAIFITKDIDYLRYISMGVTNNFSDFFLLIFYWIQRYFSYLKPDFIFFNGLDMTAKGTLGLGVLYLVQLPLLILGVIELIKRKVPYRYLIISWIIIAIIPASLTTDQRNSGRLLMILPPLIYILCLGCLKLVEILRSFKMKFLRYAISSVIILFLTVEFLHAFLVFNVHFPRIKGESFMEGTKQSVQYALANKDKYKEIVFDPHRGIEGPYIVNVPHAYILFYSQFDPAIYQSASKRSREDSEDSTEVFYGFDKFTMRRIHWPSDKYRKDTLFIGSPWNFTKMELKEGELLQDIKMSSGKSALYIVSPK